MSTTTYSPDISVGNVQLNNVYSTTDVISQAASLPPCTTPAGTNAMQGAVSLVTTAPTYGTAGFFPGPTGNYMNFGAANPVNYDTVSTNLFVECWYYAIAAGGGGDGRFHQMCAVSGPTVSSTEKWGLIYANSALNYVQFFMYTTVAGTATSAFSNGTLNYGNWYHLAGSWDATNKNCYAFLNGTVGTVASMGAGVPKAYDATTHDFMLGADFRTGNTANGYIRDLRVIKGGTAKTTSFTPDVASAPFSTTTVPYGITGGQNIFTFLNQWASSNNAAQITQWIQKTINKIAQPKTTAIAGTGVTFPSAALTSVNSTIAEGTYLVFSSSDLAGPAVPNSWQAFDKNLTVSTYWQSALTYNAAGGYAGAASLGGVNGEWLMIGLPYAVSLTSYTLYRRTDIATQMAVSFTILGSNDRVTYTSVNTQTAQSWTTPTSLTYSVTGSAAYQYYAIVVQTVGATAGTSTTSIVEWVLVGNYNTTVTTFGTPFWSSNTSSYNYTQIAIPNNAGGTGGNGGWTGCVTIPDGRIIVAPQIPTLTSMGIFNPATNLFTTIAAGGAGADYAFGGISLAPDGRVIFCPFRSTAIGIFNPVTNTFTTTTGGLTANPGHAGTCQLPNGKTLFAPYDTGRIGIFDPVTSTYRTANTFATYTMDGLGGTVPLPDGRVVFCPQGTAYALIYNYVTNTYTTFTHPSILASQYWGGACLPDGTVAFTPISIRHMGIFNPNTNSFTTIPISSSGHLGGGKVLPNGLLWLNPYNTVYYGLYNYVTKSYLTGPATGSAGAGNCQSAGLAFDGRIICPPYVNASNMGIYTGMPTPAPPEYVLHPLLNRSG